MGLHRRHWVLAGVLLLSTVTGCAPTPIVTLSGARQPERPKDCHFRMLTAMPGEGYAEIGTVDTQWWSRTLGEFKEHIRPSVCGAGGDAALAFANGVGIYTNATILKRIAPKAAAAPSPTGCQFDTQCKGDRICVDGECEEPEGTPDP